MYTGVEEIDKLGLIRKWQKRQTIRNWLNATNGGLSTCNMINGTDTTVFAPRVKPEGFQYIFATDICRYAIPFFSTVKKYNSFKRLIEFH